MSEACFLLAAVSGGADALLVRMTEMDASSVVLTLDGDFKLYRRNRRQSIPVILT